MTRVYKDAGWDLALGETVTPDANLSYPRSRWTHWTAPWKQKE
jgi:hypothetical protein